MSEEEVRKCPYCDVVEDYCPHVFAIIDPDSSSVGGAAEELFDPPCVYDPYFGIMTQAAIDDLDLVHEMRIKYFEKFQQACVGLSDHYMKEFFDSGGPGTATLLEWCWVKDVQSSLISLKEKLNKITL